MMPFKSYLIIFLFLFSEFSFSQSSVPETVGDVILYALPAASLGTTLILGDKEGTWQFAKGLLLNEAITYGMKLTIRKERPDGSNDNAFPSGHTSTSFQSATFIYMRYGWEYGLPAFALAGLCAASRIQANRHDGWDVIGGILVGVGSSLLFTTPYEEQNVQLTFNATEKEFYLGLSYRF